MCACVASVPYICITYDGNTGEGLGMLKASYSFPSDGYLLTKNLHVVVLIPIVARLLTGFRY